MLIYYFRDTYILLDSYRRINNSITQSIHYKGGIKMAEELRYSEEQKRCLARIGGIGYTVGNYIPQECKWTFSNKDIVEIISRLSKPFLSDIVGITLGAKTLNVKDNDNHKTSKPFPVAYIWLPKSSPNLVDNSLKNSDSAIKFPIPSISNNLKEYASKFSVDGKVHKLDGVSTGTEDGRRVTTGKSHTGIEVLVDKFLMLEFDINGDRYAREFGEEFRHRCNIRIDEVEFKELSHGDFTVNRIVVRKIEKRISDKEFRPRKSISYF